MKQTLLEFGEFLGYVIGLAILLPAIMHLTAQIAQTGELHTQNVTIDGTEMGVVVEETYKIPSGTQYIAYIGCGDKIVASGAQDSADSAVDRVRDAAQDKCEGEVSER